MSPLFILKQHMFSVILTFPVTKTLNMEIFEFKVNQVLGSLFIATFYYFSNPKYN